MQKIHLVFVRDVLKDVIANDSSNFHKSKLEGLLEIVRDEIETMEEGAK
jgi:hypothetical protein